VAWRDLHDGLVICAECFPDWNKREFLTIVPIAPCEKCGSLGTDRRQFLKYKGVEVQYDDLLGSTNKFWKQQMPRSEQTQLRNAELLALMKTEFDKCGRRDE
jgi:hypothetical protein